MLLLSINCNVDILHVLPFELPVYVLAYKLVPIHCSVSGTICPIKAAQPLVGYGVVVVVVVGAKHPPKYSYVSLPFIS